MNRGTYLTMNEIINSGTPIPDSSLPSGLKWNVPGYMGGTPGMWELVLDQDTKRIMHFAFVS